MNEDNQVIETNNSEVSTEQVAKQELIQDVASNDGPSKAEYTAGAIGIILGLLGIWKLVDIIKAGIAKVKDWLEKRKAKKAEKAAAKEQAKEEPKKEEKKEDLPETQLSEDDEKYIEENKESKK